MTKTKVWQVSQFDYLNWEAKNDLGIPKPQLLLVDLNNPLHKCPKGYFWIDFKTKKVIATNYDTSD